MQITNDADAGAFVTLSAGIISFVIFGFGIRVGEKNITRSDTFFFATALISTGLWLIAGEGLLAMTLLVGLKFSD